MAISTSRRDQGACVLERNAALLAGTCVSGRSSTRSSTTERGVDDLATYGTVHDWQLQVRGAYEVYLSRRVFHLPCSANTAWDGFKPDPEAPRDGAFPDSERQPLRPAGPWRMEPRPELAIGGPCLATPGQVYACYVTPLPGRPSPSTGRGQAPAPAPAAVTPAAPSAGTAPRRAVGNRREIALNLTALTGSATLQWINTWTGERVDGKVDRAQASISSSGRRPSPKRRRC